MCRILKSGAVLRQWSREAGPEGESELASVISSQTEHRQKGGCKWVQTVPCGSPRLSHSQPTRLHQAACLSTPSSQLGFGSPFRNIVSDRRVLWRQPLKTPSLIPFKESGCEKLGSMGVPQAFHQLLPPPQQVPFGSITFLLLLFFFSLFFF